MNVSKAKKSIAQQVLLFRQQICLTANILFCRKRTIIIQNKIQ